MSLDAMLELAGEAAQILDEMGFGAVARSRDGIVTLEIWRGSRGARRIVTEADRSPRLLAEACVAELAVITGKRAGPPQ